jgi:branched-chain amino acid aminotransferase
MRKQYKSYLEGKIVPLEKAALPVLDRGFLYGDGVFESLRTYGKKPFQLEGHLKRLISGARLLRIRRLPSFSQLRSAVFKVLAENNFPESYIKIIITRGSAKGHGLDPQNVIGKAKVVILVEPQRPLPKKIFALGWKAIISSIVKPDIPTSRIKSLNYTDAILARIEAKRYAANEAFMLDSKGNLAEGTISNVFIVKNGVIFTPSFDAPILIGLTRNLVIKMARQSAFKVVEKSIGPKDLYTADECFVTFSGAGIIPITRIWKRKISSGKCGYVTASLIDLYNFETEKK